jgi:hypothetical protein
MEFWDKVLAFLWPDPIHMFMRWSLEEASGEARSASQRLKYGCLGALFWMLLIWTSVWLSRH